MKRASFATPFARHIPQLLSFDDSRRPEADVSVGQRIAVVGTALPRKCGIATFTGDVVEQLAIHHGSIATDVIALDAGDMPLDYPAGVDVLRADDPAAYRAMAHRINERGFNAVWLQHEFGIFGGPDGEMVCDFVDRIAAPLVVTFHTVLAQPSPRQERIVRHLIARASRIMVMSQQGRDLLVNSFGAPDTVVEVIAHGAPDRPFGREDQFKTTLGLPGKHVLMTFGLLGPGKGLEQAIEALPAIVARHPDTVYRIVGATHPVLVARDGEQYRDGLMALAQRLGVDTHIIWENRFLDTAELLDQLEACDIYITPYHNLQQATSGTLSYAVALGKAVVSTPYVHARELLADGVGLLVEPQSTSAIADAVNRLLDDPALLAATKRRAYATGRATIWPEFAAASARLVNRAIAKAPRDVPLSAVPGLSGVFAMSDATGMLQHGIGIVPDRRHGYCLDDNARALILMNSASAIDPVDRLRWSSVYASFVQYAWNPDNHSFRNFMRYDRSWAEDSGSTDSNGRAIWALGHTIAHAPDPEMRRWAAHLYNQTLDVVSHGESPRAIAFAMLGAAEAVRAGMTGEPLTLLESGGAMLMSLLDSARRPDWAWFEAVLAYDNPRLPQALIEAGLALHRPDWTHAGLETLAWIAQRQTAEAGWFRPIGSESFHRPHDQMPFDQQPLEAQAAIEASRIAYRADRSRRWIDHSTSAYRWFFGANDRGVVLADLRTGRCGDGVTPRGVNENCGAESILAFQLGHVALMDILEGAAVAATKGDVLEPVDRSVH